MIVADETNVLPAEWGNMSDGRLWDLFTSLAQRLNSFGEIDRVPGSDGSHEEMQATGSMHLIFKRPVAQFAQASEEQLACEGMQSLSFVQTDQHTPPECLIAKILQE